MISCCVNPACRAESKSLNTGDIYAVERRSADTEFFWLCSACVPVLALSLDPIGSVSVGPRCDAGHLQGPHPDGRLRLLYGPVEHTPWLRARLARGLTFPNRHKRDPLPASSEELSNIWNTHSRVRKRPKANSNFHVPFRGFLQQRSFRH
jgi:hypothetical protein